MNVSPTLPSPNNLSHNIITERVPHLGTINGENRQEELLHAYQRYRFSSASPPEPSSNISSSASPRENQNFTLDESRVMSRRLSSSDLNISHSKRNETFRYIASTDDNTHSFRSKIRCNESHLNEHHNSTSKKRRFNNGYSNMPNVHLEKNVTPDDVGLRKSESWRHQSPFLMGHDTDQFAIDNILNINEVRKNQLENRTVGRVQTSSYNHFKPPESDNLMLVPPVQFMSDGRDERAISFEKNLKEVEKYDYETVVRCKQFVTQQTSRVGDFESYSDPQHRFLKEDEDRRGQRMIHQSPEQNIRESSSSMISYKNTHPDIRKQNTSLSFQDSELSNASSFVRRKEISFDSTIWLQNVTYDRKKKLEAIDRIFEKFVPAMRTTSISTDFIVNLINIHKRKTDEEKYSNDTSLKGHLMKLTMAEENDNGKNDAQMLSIDQLISHFDSIEESFIKFAESNRVFKGLSKFDQKQLLTRNSLLFVQVSLKYES